MSQQGHDDSIFVSPRGSDTGYGYGAPAQTGVIIPPGGGIGAYNLGPTPTIVQVKAVNNATDTGPTSIAFDTPPTIGNLIIAFLSGNGTLPRPDGSLNGLPYFTGMHWDVRNLIAGRELTDPTIAVMSHVVSNDPPSYGIVGWAKGSIVMFELAGASTFETYGSSTIGNPNGDGYLSVPAAIFSDALTLASFAMIDSTGTIGQKQTHWGPPGDTFVPSFLWGTSGKEPMTGIYLDGQGLFGQIVGSHDATHATTNWTTVELSGTFPNAQSSPVCTAVIALVYPALIPAPVPA